MEKCVKERCERIIGLGLVPIQHIGELPRTLLPDWWCLWTMASIRYHDIVSLQYYANDSSLSTYILQVAGLWGCTSEASLVTWRDSGEISRAKPLSYESSQTVRGDLWPEPLESCSLGLHLYIHITNHNAPFENKYKLYEISKMCVQ